MNSFQLANESSSLLSLSPKFILPEDKRPQLSDVTSLDSIPIIDLSDHGYNDDNPSSSLMVQKISQACEEYEFFQIVNHGIPEQFCTKMMTAITDLFNLPPEQIGQLYTTDPPKNTKLYNNYLHVEGLGIEEDCLLKTLRHQPRLRAQSNFYPPSPDPEPELTLGLPVHTDFNALTIVLQSDVSDLLVIKDGKWVAVPVNPNAFVINLGDQIQVSTVCFSYSLSTFFYKTYASRD
ncbi:Protein DOWNY MILDEW RESISTANCE 6 [Glycine max]|uniref:Fe2OG dioxygenase domain-containing protein n=2 Tax=Glycine subgen. Soja TaxID=1462606 RepID=A0A0R0KS32_SOYBN|nr:Protein DOWNY MILDEW RESISTANCE 6 [Glycine max]RZC23316.1 Protein DOWNY MILDEW RESISTANCE 6 [Glycine soja]